MSFPQISLEEEIDRQIGQAASLVLLEDFSIHFRECSFLCNTIRQLGWMEVIKKANMAVTYEWILYKKCQQIFYYFEFFLNLFLDFLLNSF